MASNWDVHTRKRKKKGKEGKPFVEKGDLDSYRRRWNGYSCKYFEIGIWEVETGNCFGVVVQVFNQGRGFIGFIACSVHCEDFPSDNAANNTFTCTKGQMPRPGERVKRSPVMMDHFVANKKALIKHALWHHSSTLLLGHPVLRSFLSFEHHIELVHTKAVNNNPMHSTAWIAAVSHPWVQ